jgi:hypothetical protein
MTISDIRTRIDALNQRSCLIPRTAESNDTSVLTLVDTVDRNDSEPSEKADPLIQALVDKLPKANAVWPIEERAKWLKAAAMAFNLIYKPGERESFGFQPTTEQAPPTLKSVG